MSLAFIYGSSVSEKTENIYDRLIGEAMANPGQSYVLIVPEQASLSAQEAILKRHPRHAISNIDILTFNRLAFRVFEETQEKTGEPLDELGKMMLLRLVTLRVEKQLTVLRKGIRKPGMLDELKSVLSEFLQYNVQPTDLEQQCALLSEHPALQAKLKDITLIYGEFLRATHEKYELLEERATRLAAAVKKWCAAEKTTFAFDGFTGFTPPQYAVLEELIQKCPAVHIGVIVGSGTELSKNKDESDLFYMSAHMVEHLTKMAIHHGISVEEAWSFTKKTRDPAIEHLERNLYRYPETAFENETDAVRFVRAKRTKDEISNVLHDILKEVRNGYRYRDFAIVTGDLEGDREEIEEQFSEAGIPFFIDSRKKVSGNIISQFIQDALAVIKANFSFDAVFSFAKNPIVLYHLRKLSDSETTAYERICEAENFAMARGYRGRKAFEKTWTVRGKKAEDWRLPEIGGTKDALMNGLYMLSDAIAGGKKSSDQTEAIRRLLIDYEAEMAIYHFSKAIGEDPEKTDAEKRLAIDELNGIYQYVQRLLTQYDTLFGDTEQSFDTFSDVLTAGLQSMVMTHVPPTKDRVVIGDLKRTRLKEIKKLYVLKVNDGVLPKNHAGEGLINDRDREILKSMSLPLAETVREQAFFERFYIYLLLTKPSETLTLSYITTAKDGRGALPSDLFGLLQNMFPKATLRQTLETPLSEMNSARDGLDILSGHMKGLLSKKSEPEESVRALYRWFSERGEYQDALQKIGEGLFYRHQDEKLSAELARKLYSNHLTGSVTLLENYASCPYKHFLGYGLGLEEKEAYKIELADVGSILHESIDAFFRAAKERGENWYGFSEDDERALLTDCVNQAVLESNSGMLNETARNAYIQTRVQRLSERTLWALKKQWNEGAFSDTRTELDFGVGREYPEIRMPLEDGCELVLRGRIDRLDTVEEDGRIYVKIIDYKSSGKTLEYGKINEGLQLQLLIYLGAACEGEEKASPDKEVVPAGVYYYGMTDPVVDEDKEDPEEEIFKALKMNGLTNGDPESVSKIDVNYEKSTVVYGLKFVKSRGVLEASVSEGQLKKLEAHAKNRAKEIAGKILSGEIPVRPYVYNKESGCDYCPYRAVCGFDPHVKGYEENVVKELCLEQLANPKEGESRD